jgi:hypothetical protein
MMIQVNDRWRRVTVTTAGRTTGTASVTGRLTRTGGRRLVSGVPFG